MKNKYSIFLFVIILLIGTTAISPGIPAVHAMPPNPGEHIESPGGSAGDLPSLADLLRPDGGLDLTSGFSGSLDPTDYSMSYAADGSPRFTPKAPLAPADTWNALGSGVNGLVYAIAVAGSNVYVGGTFTAAGAVANTAHIARWDTISGAWNAVGNGLNGNVYAIAVVGADVYVGGGFSDAGGIGTADFIACWDGSAWNALGNVLNGLVWAMAVEGSNLYVVGYFSEPVELPNANYIARWDINHLHLVCAWYWLE